MPEGGVPRDEAGVGRAWPLILMSYRATPQASTGVTPNMMMLGRQTRLPVQAMYGAPLGPEEEESTVSEYVTALQGGLRAAYRHARAGLQRAALHQKHDYYGKVQRREYQAGGMVWIHDITRAQCSSPKYWIEDGSSCAGNETSRSLWCMWIPWRHIEERPCRHG